MAPGPLAAALQGHDMFLYFGHGSGDQYLSARCVTTVLLPCHLHTLPVAPWESPACCFKEAVHFSEPLLVDLLAYSIGYAATHFKPGKHTFNVSLHDHSAKLRTFSQVQLVRLAGHCGGCLAVLQRCSWGVRQAAFIELASMSLLGQCWPT